MYRYITLKEFSTLLKDGVIQAESEFGHPADEDNGWRGEGKAIFIWLTQETDYWESLSQWYFENILYPDRIKITFKNTISLLGMGYATYHKRDRFIDDEWYEDHYREGYLASYSLRDVFSEFEKENVEDVLKAFLSSYVDIYDIELWDVLLDEEDLEGITIEECKEIFEFLISHTK